MAAWTDLWLPILAFAISSAFTPGPNNVMLTASGATFGFRRTIPHMLGISLGFPAMVLAVGLGLGGLFIAVPQIHQVLKYVGATYLLWLAWRIARSGRQETEGNSARPLSFIEAALFQWVNPKAWMIAVGAIAAFTSLEGNVLAEVALIVGIFLLVCPASTMAWAGFGVGIGRLLRSDRMLRAFNIAMAALLVASIIPILV